MPETGDGIDIVELSFETPEFLSLFEAHAIEIAVTVYDSTSSKVLLTSQGRSTYGQHTFSPIVAISPATVTSSRVTGDPTRSPSLLMNWNTVPENVPKQPIGRGWHLGFVTRSHVSNAKFELRDAE